MTTSDTAGMSSSWIRGAFLQALNLLQFAEGFMFASTEDVERRKAAGRDVYPLPRPHSFSIAAEEPPPDEPDADPLEGMDLMDDERPLVEAVLAAGGPRPEVGFELIDAEGRCVAEAKLAWPQARVAVLVEDNPAEVRAFGRDGWRLITDVGAVEQLVAAVCADEGS